ncbi:MAG: ImmA/IrrE family metallo-endopeptidase [Burkholderia gladioli]|uniref:ImmA/IrrE family metallo-endopeptidase n=1 Tax=Burkholderia gladioli TaxID=28095 RepID=UPI001FC86F15|nr:ImmA/IrrE family metallo-endopeptidase [Burkholderia gladioli]
MDIRHRAALARDAFAIRGGRIDLGRFLENLVRFSITLDVLPDSGGSLPPNVEACWIPESLTLCLRESVYRDACHNDPRALFTVFHEMGHFALGHRRTLNRERPGVEIKTYEDSEWQANQFAAEFLMPLDEIRRRRYQTESELMSVFGVSREAARIRLERLRKSGEI